MGYPIHQTAKSQIRRVIRDVVKLLFGSSTFLINARESSLMGASCSFLTLISFICP